MHRPKTQHCHLVLFNKFLWSNGSKLLKLLCITLVALFCFKGGLIGQDLIERTLNGALDKTILKSSTQVYSLFEISKSLKSIEYTKYTEEAIYLKFDHDQLERLLKDSQVKYVIEVPVAANKSFNLLLEEVEILAPGYFMETSVGNIIFPDRNSMKFLHGTIESDPNSMVSISIINNKVRGFLSDEEGNYIIGELYDKPGRYTLYNDKTLKIQNDFSCGSSDLGHGFPLVKDYSTPSKSNTSPCIPIYVEADYQTYLDHGSNTDNVQDYIMDLISEVAVIYSNNTGTSGIARSIPITLSSTFIWTSSDPYRSSSDLGQILEDFGELRKNTPDGRLKHLISTRNIGGGVAWLDVLSWDYFTFSADWDNNGQTELHHAGPYAVSYGLSTSVTSYPTYSWNVGVFAHEMGHNMGSPHTQACAWNGNNTALDGCYGTERYNGQSCSRPSFSCDDLDNIGTIMSYCHIPCSGNYPLSNLFGAQPGQLIFDEYLACLNFRPNDLQCMDPDVYGCTDINGHNYDSSATADDGSCETCDDGTQNGDEIGVDCGGTLCSPCQGCTDVDAHNYDSIATVDDGSCETCDDNILNGDEIGVDCGGTLCSPCQGCTDSDAHNYDPIATVNDGSCETCDDNTLNGDEEYIDCGGSRCAPCITGCDNDTDAYNYVIHADIEEACETCFDGILNGDEQAVDCGGSYPGCPACITGCKEVFADNYNPNADIAGACIYDCDASTTSMVDNTNKNKIIISNSNNLSTEMLQNIEVDTSMPVYWRAQQTIELNQGFSVKSGTEITIDSGPCAND